MTDELLNTLRRQKQESQNLLKRTAAPRTLKAELQSALKSALVKVICGPRRAGKSTLALQVLRDSSFAYLNFEDESLPQDISGNELTEALDTIFPEAKILLFDEIQLFPKWEQFINKLHRQGKNILITGSNSQLLSGELASSLTGRHRVFELFPLSYQEYLTGTPFVRTSVTSDAKILEQEFFQTYFDRSGFPEVALANEAAQPYLTALFDSILLRDIVHRHRLRAPQSIRNLALLLVQAATSRYSARRLAASVPGGLSVVTVQKYIHFLEEAYLLFPLQPFFAKPRQRMKADRKMYVVDHGFIHAHRNVISPARSAVLENIVFIELCRRGGKPNQSLFYFVTKSGYEVDFVLFPDNQRCELFQVCFSLYELKTRERELRSLVDAARELDAKRCTIITIDEESDQTISGVQISAKPARQWLLE